MLLSPSASSAPVREMARRMKPNTPLEDRSTSAGTRSVRSLTRLAMIVSTSFTGSTVRGRPCSRIAQRSPSLFGAASSSSARTAGSSMTPDVGRRDDTIQPIRSTMEGWVLRKVGRASLTSDSVSRAAWSCGEASADGAAASAADAAAAAAVAAAVADVRVTREWPVEAPQTSLSSAAASALLALSSARRTLCLFKMASCWVARTLAMSGSTAARSCSSLSGKPCCSDNMERHCTCSHDPGVSVPIRRSRSSAASARAHFS
mmetsp:Transcript_2673/g.10613  ORF Transcript_2673/g.10613 Transcript_2673/m.10613 type:complete len:261 (+) Transcript_2673:4495-5277(+)